MPYLDTAHLTNQKDKNNLLSIKDWIHDTYFHRWFPPAQLSSNLGDRFETSALDPSKVPNVKLWVRADSESYADNDAVGQANDLSGNANHLTQATAGKKPTFKTAVQGGRSAYRYDGGDSLNRASFALSTYAVIVAFRASTGAGLLYEHGAGAIGGLIDGSFLYTGITTIFVRRSASISGRDHGVGHWGWTDVPQVAVHFYGGTHWTNRLWTDGYAYPMTHPGGSGWNADPGTGTVTATFDMGSSNNAAGFGLTGDIYEMVVVSPAPTWVDALGVARYMGRYYDVPF